MYIYERENWTDFRWDSDKTALLLDNVAREQGKLYGRVSEAKIQDIHSQIQAIDEQLKAMDQEAIKKDVYEKTLDSIVDTHASDGCSSGQHMGAN